jgi:hypothetical protein
MTYVKNNDFASLVVDGVKNQERIAHDGEYPNVCFIGEVADRRKLPKHCNQSLDTIHHSRGSGSVAFINI